MSNGGSKPPSFTDLETLKKLLSVGQSLIVVRDVAPLLHQVAETAGTVLGADIIVLYEYQEDTDDVRVPPIVWGEIHQPEVLSGRGHRQPHKASAVFKMIERKRPFYARNADTEWETLLGPRLPGAQDFIHREGVVSSAGVCLIADEKSLGVLFVNYRTPHAFEEEEQKVIEFLATQAAIAIQNARLWEREVNLLRQADALREVSVAVNSAAGLEDVAGRVLDVLGQVVPYRKATMQLIQGDVRSLVAYRGFGEDEINLQLLRPISQDPLIRRLTESKEPLILSETALDPDWEPRLQTQDVLSWAGVPLIYGGRVTGLLTLDHDQPGFYTASIAGLLVSFASQAAIVAENARLFDDAQRRIRDLQILNDVAPVMSDTLNTRELLGAIAAQIREKLRCTHCVIFFPEEEGEKIWLVPRVIESELAETIRSRRFEIGEGLAGWAYQYGESILLDDARNDDRFVSARKNRDQPRSMLVVPIKVGDQTIGVISADQDEYGWFSDKDLRLVDALARQAGIAIQRNAGLELLQNVGDRINSAQGMDEILQHIASGAIRLTHTTSGIIYLVEDGHLAGKSYKFPPNSLHPAPREDGSTRRVIASGQVMVFPDVPKDSRVNPKLRKRIRSMIALPLLHEREVVGVLYLNDKDAHAFTETEVSLLRSLANQAATAIVKARLVANLERQVTWHGALNEVGVELAKLQDEGEILCAVARSAARTTSCTHCSVFRVEGPSLVIKAVDGSLAKELPPGKSFPLDQGIAGWVARTGQPALVPDTSQDERFDPSWASKSPQSLVAVPICVENRVYGIISVERLEKRAFDEQDRQLLETLALQASQAIRNAQRIHDLEILNRAGHLISSKLDIKQLLTTLLETVDQTLQCVHSTLFLVEPSGDLVVHAWHGRPKEETSLSRFPKGKGLVGWVAEHRQSINIPNVSEDPRYLPTGPRPPDKPPRAMLLAPMLLQGKVIGVITADKDVAGGFDESDRQLLETLASQAAIAYENARLFRALQQQAEELGLLHDVSTRLMTFDLDKLLHLIVDGATRLTGTKFGFIYLLNQDGTKIARAVGSRDNHPISRDQLSESGLTRKIVKTRKPVFVPDSSQDERVGHDITDLGIQSFIGQPLMVGEKVIGVLYLDDTEQRQFSESERGLISTLASQAAVAIENARLVEQLEYRVKHLSALNRVAGQLGALPDRQKMFQTVAKEANSTLEAARSTLSILNEERKLVAVATEGPADETKVQPYLQLGARVAEWVAEAGQSVLTAAANRDHRFVPGRGDRPDIAYPIIAAPVWAEGKVIGVITVERESGAMFDEAGLHFLETLAIQAGIFIRQESLRRRRIEAIKRRFNPYVVGEPIRKPSDFFGRQWLIQQILDGIHKNNFIIYGERRIGKTSLLNQLVYHLKALSGEEKVYCFVPILTNLQGIPEESFFRFLIERIVHAASIPSAELPSDAGKPLYTHIDLEEDLEAVVGILQQQHPGREVRIVLLLDEMDQFIGYTSPTHDRFRSLFAGQLGIYLKMVVAGVTVQRVKRARTSPWYNLFREIELLSLAEVEARQLVVEPVLGYYTYDQEALEYLLECSDFKPQDLQSLASLAVSTMLARLPIVSTDEQAPLAEAIIQLSDVQEAVQLALQEKDGEYHDYWIGLNDNQRRMLTTAVNQDNLVDLSATDTDGEQIFAREDLYNVSRPVGQQVQLTWLFARWLKGVRS